VQKSTFTVGVIVANILHYFSTHVIRAIENYFNEKGFHIIVCNADDEPEKERKYIEVLRAKQVDGMIIFPTGDNIDLYKEMIKDDFPIVFMDRIIKDLPISSVLLDNHLAAQMAVDHFVEQGHSRIAIVTTSIIRQISPRVERIEGYKIALQNHGLEINSEYIKTADIDKVFDALKELFSLNAPPNAIIAGNDIVLIEMLKYIKKYQIKIPDEVAVIGIDDVTTASLFTPSITTISQPAIEMANRAVDLLLNKIEKNTEPEEKLVFRMNPSLVKRDSC